MPLNFLSKYLLCVGCYLTISLTAVATVNIDSLHKVIASTTDIEALASAHKAASLFYFANNQEKLALKHARVLLNYYRNKQVGSINYDIVYNLASYYYRQRCSDSGIYVIEIAEKILRENNALQNKLWGTAVIKATFYVFDNKFKSAISLLDSIETEILDNSLADSLRAGLDWLRGSIYKKQSILEKSLAYYLRALKYHEAKGSPRASPLMNNCALIYSALNEYSKAEELLIKAHEINKKRKNKIWLANGFLNLGNLYRNTKQYKKSYANYYEAKLIADSLDNMKLSANVNEGMGALFLDLSGDTSVQFFNENEVLVAQSSLVDSASKYYNNVLKIAEKLKSEKLKQMAYAGMGQLFIHVNEYISAIHYLEMGELIARKDGLKMSMMNANKYLAHAHQQEAIRLINLGKYKKASEHFLVYTKKQEIYQQLKDSIFSNTKIRELSNVEQTYLLEKKDREAARVQDLENERKKNLRNIIYAVFTLLMFVLIFLYVMYKRFKVTKQLNQLIRSQQVELKAANEELERKAANVTSSITYAERIQSAILPPMALMQEKLKDGFVLYKPKDIVSGDFFWLETIRDEVYFSAADCTGHGVPGAIMSVMCSNALTKSVKELGLIKPGDILDATTKVIEERFERSEQMVLDGMDLALCKLNLKTMKLEYAGANNPLWIIRASTTIPPHHGGGAKGGRGKTPHKQTTLEETKPDDSDRNLIEVKADKQPIGMYDDRKPYTNHQIQLQKGDLIYIFSDGFVDQFGGPKGKKFKSKPFKKLLLSIQEQSMDRQKELINEALVSWQGDIEQVDDICVIGVKV